MFYENYPQFLDSILFAFSEDYNNSKSLEELKSIVFKREFSKGYDLSKPDENLKRVTNELFTYSDYLRYGLNFLQQEGLITFDGTKRDNEKSINITSNGFFKIKTQGFVDKIKNDKEVIKLQKHTFYIAIFSLLVSVLSVGVTAYFSNGTSENEKNNTITKTSSNCNHKICTIFDYTQSQPKHSIKSSEK